MIDCPGAARSTMYLGLPVIDPSNPDWVPLEVMNALLGGSLDSRITSALSDDTGDASSPYGTVSARYRDAYWVEVADIMTAVTGAALAEIFGEIDRLRRAPPSTEELRRIQHDLASTFVLRSSSRETLLRRLQFVDLHGRGRAHPSTYLQRVAAVTPHDVQRVAER